MSLFNDWRPKCWSDFKGGDVGTRYLMNRVSTGKHPNAVWLTGPPGVGKSSLAYLYVRSTLCPNREEGSSEGCGTCPTCLGTDNTNITYYLVRDSSSAKEVLEDLVEVANTRPVIKDKDGTRADQYRRFIIIDEAELIHPTTFSVLLNPLEYSASTTTWILISMEPDKLPYITREAMESRCKEVNLNPIPIEVVKDHLASLSGGVDLGVIDLVSEFSGGNMRRAWSILELLVDSGVTTRLEASKALLGNASEDVRAQLWAALASKDVTTLKSIVSSWSSLEPSVIGKCLMDDVTKHQPISIPLVRVLDNYIRFKTSLLGSLLMVLGERVKLDSSENSLPVVEESKALIPLGSSPSPEFCTDLGRQILLTSLANQDLFRLKEFK